MKTLFKALLLCLLPYAALAQGPAAIFKVPTVALLRSSIPVAAAAAIHDVQVMDYYGTGSGCPIYYTWNSSDSTADNGGTIINPTGNGGNGRWDANIPKGPVHSCVFGIKSDSTFGGSNGTDNSTQVAALFSWAHGSGPNWVHLDSNPAGLCIRITTSQTMYEGMVISGDGPGQAAGGKTGSCLNYSPTTGYVFSLQTPINAGLGNQPFEGPKWHDFTINYSNSNANVGGCMSMNSAGGGFNNSAADQQNVMHFNIDNVTCNLGFITGNQQIGFYCAKCFDSRWSNVHVINGLTGFYLDGSDNMAINGGCRVSNTYGPMVKLISELTFGNNDNVSDCEFLGFADTGASQTIDSAVYSTARSMSLSHVFLEGAAPSGGSITQQINLAGGIQAYLSDNVVTVGTSSTPWLHVSTLESVTAIGNSNAGAPVGVATFAAIPYYYNSNVQTQLAHYGNASQGDNGWPFNSVVGSTQTYAVPVAQIWTPSTQGLQYTGLGTTEVPVNNAFTFSAVGTGSTNYLDFRRYENTANLTGTLNGQIRAWSTTNGHTLTCQLTDNGALVGSPIVNTLATTPAIFSMAFATSIATDGGIRCWVPANTDSFFSQVSLTH